MRRAAFDRIHRLAYAQLRHHGVRQPAFAIRLLGSLGRLGATLPLHRRDTVIDECEEVIDGARREIRSARDLERVEQAAQRALAQIAAQQRQKGAVQA